jgi:lysine 2,3-aminomutase
MSDHKVVLRNFEGFITSYEEPVDYSPSDAAKYQVKRPEPGQAGILGLLEGEQMVIKPEGFDEIRDRNGIQHRLKDERKWVPLGIGEGSATIPKE